MQTPRQLNSQRTDTNFFSARDISRMLNKANSCIEFWWRKAKPSIWAFSQEKKQNLASNIFLVEKRAYCVIMRVCLPSESTYGYLISLCHWAGWKLESQGFQGWDYAWRGVELLPLCDWKTSTSLGPVYCTFALLSSTRLLGTISGQAAHIWASVIRFPVDPPHAFQQAGGAEGL